MQGITQKILVYPENLPPDRDVEVDLSIAESKPILGEQENMFCKICQTPMVFQIELKPCQHFICESCFDKFNQECKYCGFEIQDAKVHQETFQLIQISY